MDTYGLFVQYGNDPERTRIISREATGTLMEVAGYLVKWEWLMDSLGAVSYEIKRAGRV